MLSPVELKRGQTLYLALDVPKLEPAKIESTVWHVRSLKVSSTRRQIWSAGMVLVESDYNYGRLLALALAEQNVSVEDDPNDKSEELQVFRVRVQVKGEPRIRVLTLEAATENDAHEMALADLDDSWTIIDVREVSAANLT